MDSLVDISFDPALAQEERRHYLTHTARDLASEIGCIETDEDKLSVLMGLGALVAEVAALAARKE